MLRSEVTDEEEVKYYENLIGESDTTATDTPVETLQEQEESSWW